MRPYELGRSKPRVTVSRRVTVLYVIRGQPRRHGLNAFAFAGKQQTRAVGFQRHGSIQVPCGSRQAIEISRKASLLRAMRRRRGAHAPRLPA